MRYGPLFSAPSQERLRELFLASDEDPNIESRYDGEGWAIYVHGKYVGTYGEEQS
jgi:hypothetical protein